MSVQQYGITLTWGTAGAPHPASCILESFDYKAAFQQHLEDSEAGDVAAMVLHGQKGAISFGGTITDATVDLPDLSTGAKLDLSSAEIVGGTVLCASLIEEWAIGQPKKFNGSATHYPDVTGGAGAEAGALSGFTPTQTLSPVIRPADKLIWSTAGLTHASGTVQKLRIEQTLQLTEQVDGAAKIVTVTAHRYMRKISLEILGLASGTAPATNTVLAVVGAPSHASNAVVTDSGKKWQRGQGAMYSVEAIWFPGISGS